MPNSCFVPNCKSGYITTRKRNKLEGKKNPSIFSAPSDAETFDLWVKNIPCRNRPFSFKDAVCDLHFTEDCIERFLVPFPLTGADDEYRLRTRPKLKKGSVPTIFPSCSSSSNGNDLKRKLPSARSRKSSMKVEITDILAAETSVTDDSIAESSYRDDDTTESSVNNDSIAELSSHNNCDMKPSRASDIVEQSTNNCVPDSLPSTNKVAEPPHDVHVHIPNPDNRLPHHDNHVPNKSQTDTNELSSHEELSSNVNVIKVEPRENGLNKRSLQNGSIPSKKSSIWNLNDLYNYANSLQSLQEDSFSCFRVQSAVILQQWHPSSYHCSRMIIIEENLRSQIYVGNERIRSEEVSGKISSKAKLRSLIAIVKEMKICPKISDFHLESFYSKIVQRE